MPSLSLCLSLLERSLEKAVELGGEWLYDTILTGPAAEAAFARVLSQQKLNMEQQFIQQGNVYAATRASAHYTVDGAVSERCSGVSYYKFLCGVPGARQLGSTGRKAGCPRTEVLQHAELTVSPVRQRGCPCKAAHSAAGQPALLSRAALRQSPMWSR